MYFPLVPDIIKVARKMSCCEKFRRFLAKKNQKEGIRYDKFKIDPKNSFTLGLCIDFTYCSSFQNGLIRFRRCAILKNAHLYAKR